MLRQSLAFSALLSIAITAQAAFLGDPASFRVNVEDDGTFGDIVLEGTVMDSGNPQRQFANGREFIDGEGVTVDPSGAHYTAYIDDAASPGDHLFKVDVVSVIRGSLSLTIVPNSVLEQYFTFTNLTASARGLESVASYVSYLNDDAANDRVAQDGTRPVVYSTDAPSGQLVALAARAGTYTIAWDVTEIYGVSPTTAGLQNRSGPIVSDGIDWVEMAVGLDAGILAPGGQATLLFSYLFSTDMSAPPPGFPAPAPGALALMGLGLAGMLGSRARRDARPA